MSGGLVESVGRVHDWESRRGRWWPRRLRPYWYVRLSPMWKLATKFTVVVLMWLVVDSIIFWAVSQGVCTKEADASMVSSGKTCWTAAYAAWFAVQSGFGVGWATGPERHGLQYFTAAHCLVGEFFVMAAIELFFIQQARRMFVHELDRRRQLIEAHDRRSECERDGVDGRTDGREDGAAFRLANTETMWGATERGLLLAWIAWAGLGFAYGMVYEDLGIASALLYSVSALTTAGLVPPAAGHKVRPASPLVFGTVFLLVGIPLTAALGSACWAKYYAKYERRARRKRYYESLVRRRFFVGPTPGVATSTPLLHQGPASTRPFQVHPTTTSPNDDSLPSRRALSHDAARSLVASTNPTSTPLHEPRSAWALYLETELIDTGLVDRRLLAEIRLGYFASLASARDDDDDITSSPTLLARSQADLSGAGLYRDGRSSF